VNDFYFNFMCVLVLVFYLIDFHSVIVEIGDC
jgi:hypothetical protein